MSESQEFLEPKSSTDQNKFKNLMLAQNVDYLTSEKLVTTIFPILFNAKRQLHALLF